MLVRLSGMYYGDTRGVQMDVGYVISRNAYFRQYVALSAISFQATADYYSFWSDSNVATYKDVFTGVGPSWGFNWNRLSLQIGVAFGNDQNSQSYAGYTTWNGNYVPPSSSTTVTPFMPQFIFQLGYTFLF